MLKKNPEVGEAVVALQDAFWDDGDPYALEGDVYQIEGIHEESGNVFYIFEGEEIYIDEDSWYLYELDEYKCDHDNIKQTDHVYEDGYLVEFVEVCEDCGRKMGTEAYGCWFANEDED